MYLTHCYECYCLCFATGMTPEDLHEAARRVRLAPGCRAVLQRAAAGGLPTHVLSINWCSQVCGGGRGAQGMN
jgi:hypothetical protein